MTVATVAVRVAVAMIVGMAMTVAARFFGFKIKNLAFSDAFSEKLWQILLGFCVPLAGGTSMMSSSLMSASSIISSSCYDIVN